MKSDPGISKFELVLDCLGIIWTPGVEALKLQQDLNRPSLKDISAAAERAGYEVCYVDLPMSVSGFAQVIAGKPYIVINRAKSPHHRQYTVAHELGHHVLHLNPSRDPHQLELSSKDLAEGQAHLFAATWVVGVANDKEREDFLRQNPESFGILLFSLFTTFAIISVAVLAHLWSRFISPRLSGSGEGK